MAERPTRPDSEPEPSAATVERVGLGSGSATPAAPQDRPDRRAGPASLVAGTYALLAAGVVLLGAALLAAETASTAGLTALAGALTIALAAALPTELMGPRPIGIVGLFGGVALGVSGLAPDTIGGPEIGRLLAGALMLLGCSGILVGSMSSRDQGGQA